MPLRVFLSRSGHLTSYCPRDSLPLLDPTEAILPLSAVLTKYGLVSQFGLFSEPRKYGFVSQFAHFWRDQFFTGPIPCR